MTDTRSPEEHWAMAQELMEAALELEPSRRAGFLEDECPEEGLRHEVLSLLAYAGSTATFIDQPAIQLPPISTEEKAGFPEQIGTYRLLRPLGHGGMGSVYLAVRSDGIYQKPIALKLLQDGLGGTEMIRRFRHEREILANLEHPYIARLLDGGTFSGRPYLVMEYVDGLPIDRYCQSRRLPLIQRLQLFRKVCEAVHFAHQNLVVHRDIKPSNLFVTEAGVPKLLDFGIAKLLRSKDFPHTVVATVPGRAPMTPAYASPEQVRGGPITTATDVYSLGILLFELLTGRRPYEVSGASPGEVEQMICEDLPLRPSWAVGQKLEETAAPTGTAPTESSTREQRRLRRALRGDLDNIVLMTLRKEPQRRYASAEQLGHDLGRFIDGLPVIAHRDTLSYRFSKFVLRHKIAVASTTAVFITLVGLVFGLLVQKEEILDQRNRAQFTSGFLQDLFTNADPWTSGSSTLSARELLDRGAREIVNRRNDPPEVRADLLTTMGRSYLYLGEYQSAENLLRESLEMRQRLYSGDHSAVAESLVLFSQLRTDEGHYEEAERLSRQSLEMRRRLHPEPHQEVVDSLFRLARLLDQSGRYDEARTVYREALEIVRTLDHPELLATVLDRFGLLLAQLAEYDEGELMLREALNLHSRTLGPEHPKVAFTLHSLARLLRDRPDLIAAEELLRRAEAIQRKAFGAQHPHLASTLGSLGMVLHRSGRSEDGEAHLAQAVAMQRKISESSPKLATIIISLSHLHTGVGRLDEAEKEAREALTMNRRLLAEGHPRIAYALDALGLAALTKGDLDTAEASLQEALDIYQETFGKNHPRTAEASWTLAKVAYRRKNYAGAEELCRLALVSYRSTLGEDDRKIALIYNDLGVLLRKQEKFEMSQAMYQKAIPIARRVMAPDDADLGLILNNFGRVHLSLGQPENAEFFLLEALSILEHSPKTNHQTKRLARRLLARSLAEQQRFSEADTVLRAHFFDLKDEFGLDHKETQDLLAQMQKMYTAWGQGGEDLMEWLPPQAP